MQRKSHCISIYARISDWAAGTFAWKTLRNHFCCVLFFLFLSLVVGSCIISIDWQLFSYYIFFAAAAAFKTYNTHRISMFQPSLILRFFSIVWISSVAHFAQTLDAIFFLFHCDLITTLPLLSHCCCCCCCCWSHSSLFGFN